MQQWNGPYGFVAADDPRAGRYGRVFVHRSALWGIHALKAGDRVAFDLTADPTKPGRDKAVDVELLPQNKNAFAAISATWIASFRQWICRYRFAHRPKD